MKYQVWIISGFRVRAASETLLITVLEVAEMWEKGLSPNFFPPKNSEMIGKETNMMRAWGSTPPTTDSNRFLQPPNSLLLPNLEKCPTKMMISLLPGHWLMRYNF